MKKILVIGGSGRVATQLIQNLVTDGNEVTAAARHPEKIVNHSHITAIKLDLHATVVQLASLMNGIDVVYFVAGSRGHDLLQTDAMGAVKTMQAAEQAGVKRYVMLSSMYALQPEKWSLYPALAGITDYNIAKYFADHYLVNNTHLDYTILQPATLTEEAGTGKVAFGEGDDSTNTIPDVAKVLAEIIKYDNTIGQVIMMRNGETPIDQALKQV